MDQSPTPPPSTKEAMAAGGAVSAPPSNSRPITALVGQQRYKRDAAENREDQIVNEKYRSRTKAPQHIPQQHRKIRIMTLLIESTN